MERGGIYVRVHSCRVVLQRQDRKQEEQLQELDVKEPEEPATVRRESEVNKKK